MVVNVLLVSRKKESFSGIMTVFNENNISFDWSPEAVEALVKINNKNFDLVIVAEDLPDMEGRQFVEKLVMKNPMLNCVVASQLPHDEFHETYEGLGVLMQFPLMPGSDQVQSLMDHLSTIARISGNIPVPKGV